MNAPVWCALRSGSWCQALSAPEQGQEARKLLNTPTTSPIKDGGMDEGGTTASTDKVRACPSCGGPMPLVETFDVSQATTVCSRYSIKIGSGLAPVEPLDCRTPLAFGAVPVATGVAELPT
jgi:hypothetical protein